MYNIYLVDDEIKLNDVLKSYLEKEDFNVTSFYDGSSAIESIEDKPDMWILDIMLPDIDGYELIKKIKEIDDTIPVIFISARDKDLDKIIGLELGSDDYLAKPFLPRELVIRVKKLLSRIHKDKVKAEKKIVLENYDIDLESRTVTNMDNNEILDLTSKEFDILHMFIENKGQAFSRDKVLDIVWGDDYFGSDRVVDDLIRRLRKKIPNSNIETIYGFGYRMKK